MGCFNQTGFLSGLPISAGDEVILIILKRNKYNKTDNIVYSTDAFIPQYLPIVGKYNDYGGIEDVVKDWNVEYIEKVTRQSIEDYTEEIDDAVVKRVGAVVYKGINYCFELKQVYDELSKRQSDYIVDYIDSLDSIGFKYSTMNYDKTGVEFTNYTLKQVKTNKEDFYKYYSFFRSVKSLCANFRPSNYHNQDQRYDDHLAFHQLCVDILEANIKKQNSYDD